MTSPVDVETLRRIPMFRNLGDDPLRPIARLATSERHRKHAVLFRQDEVSDGCYVIISGLIKIHSRSGDGRFKTLAILEAGDCFGEMAMITSERRSACASCLEDSELLALRAAGFMDLIAATPVLAVNLLKILAERLRKADEQIEDLTFKNLPGRIVSELLRLTEQFGADHPRGRLIDLVVTHQEIADMVGTNRETVSKYISSFKREGSLDTVGRRFVLIDEEMLQSWL